LRTNSCRRGRVRKICERKKKEGVPVSLRKTKGEGSEKHERLISHRMNRVKKGGIQAVPAKERKPGNRARIESSRQNKKQQKREGGQPWYKMLVQKEEIVWGGGGEE